MLVYPDICIMSTPSPVAKKGHISLRSLGRFLLGYLGIPDSSMKLAEWPLRKGALGEDTGDHPELHITLQFQTKNVVGELTEHVISVLSCICFSTPGKLL